MQKNLGLVAVEITTVEDAYKKVDEGGVEDGADGWVKQHADEAQPGQPAVTFWNVEA